MNFNYYMMRNDNHNNVSSTSLFSPEEGYNLGNMFADLYSTYKDYKPVKLEGRTPEEKSFLELSRVAFAMHEMNLYLDTHPDDMMVQNLFNDYRRMFIELEEKYERNYGPLTITSNTLEKSPFAWVTDVFPWEGGSNV